MTVLGIDTSSAACSAALTRDGKLLGEIIKNSGLTHSETIMPAVEALLDGEGLSPMDIDLFAAVAGPGSFTGVRIGICAVKAMAEAAGKPCARVDALEAIAEGSAFEGLICPILDARRQQVYTGLFKRENGELRRVRENAALPLEELIRSLQSETRVYFTGDGLNTYEAQLRAELGAGTLIAPMHIRVLRASAACFIAERREELRVSARDLTPLYLRLPQAERERNARLAREGV